MEGNGNTTAQERKRKAVELLKRLQIFQPYVKGFEENDLVCFFENFIGFWAFQDPELEAKVKEIEQNYNCTVYAITHEFTFFGECYDFLIVPDYPEDWNQLVRSKRNNHSAFAYVWNKSNDEFSELGMIALKSFCGGIRRIGID